MRANEFADLNAFVAVADEMSFTKAARRLGLSPASLSLSVRALEERLSVTCHFDSALDTANMTVAPSINKMPSGTRSARRGARSARLSEVNEKPQQVRALA